MKNQTDHAMLEPAALPREQVGPFLLLGLDKDADAQAIEAHWAQRVIRARKNQTRIPLQDIHWARETLNDPDKRVRADAASLNSDTMDGVLRRLTQQFGAGDAPRPTWEPVDIEKDLADYTPVAEVPRMDDIRDKIAVPPLPREIPVVARLLEQFMQEPLDPWNLELPRGTDKEMSQ